MAIANLRVPITPLPTPDTSWLDSLSNSLGSAIDTAAQNKAFEQNVIPAITGTPAPQQQPGFIGRLLGQQSIPAPTAQRQIAASNPAPVQGSVAAGTPNDIQNQFIGTVRTGGLTNPYGLAALAATGRAESSWDPSKVNASWADPSQSGQAGTAGGILSWRNERLANLRNYAQSQGADPSNISPELQAKFFLQEDPTLIDRLNAAKSPQEAASIMANAWKFKGYDQPGGEAARRAALTQNYYATQFANGQPAAAPTAPTQVASLDPSIGMPMPEAAGEMRASNPAPSASGFDPATATPGQLNAALGPPQASNGYVDPTVTTAYRQLANAAPATVPAQTVAMPAATANPAMIAAAQPASRQNVTNDQIAAMVRNPYTRQVGLQLWQQVLTGKTAQPWSFVKLDDGTLARTNASTGEVQSLGKFASGKKDLLSNGKGAFYDSENAQWIVPPEGVGGDQNEFFGTTIPYYDQNGNLRYRQLAKNGRSQDVDLGPGATAAPNTKTVDDGVNIHVQGPGGQDIAVIPKQNRTAAQQTAQGTAEGKAAGEAVAALPGTEGFANSLQSDIKKLKDDPYLPKMLGWSHYLPNFSPDAARVQGKLDQLQGGSFLAARNWLKGQGPITDFESGRAERAYARLSTAQNEKDFNDALDDFYSAVQQGVDVVAKVAGSGPRPNQPPASTGNTTSSGVKWSIEQ